MPISNALSCSLGAPIETRKSGPGRRSISQEITVRQAGFVFPLRRPGPDFRVSIIDTA
jgi:hypothetical protein